jgi:NADH-quinone oxidoreductase subunit E
MPGGRASNAQEIGMSTFPIRTAQPGEATRSKGESGLLPPEIAGAVSLLVNPLAGAAAFSALGIGLASHAFGVWMGAVSSAAEMSERLLASMEGGMTSGRRSFGSDRGSAEKRAATTARALIADARSAAPVAAAGISGDARAPAGARPTDTGSEPAPGGKDRLKQPVTRPAAPDDLKAISGIGPKLEKVLNGLGIFTYAQIAGWGKEDIARVNGQLSFNGRIERDDWIAQARTLAGNAVRH